MHPAENQLPPGTVLRQRYVIKRTISRGGFGNVYLADDQTEQREVAIKEAFFNDEDTRVQFEVEGHVLIVATHPGIVRGFASFEEGERFYLVMQYIAGQNLEEMQIDHFKAHRGPMPEAEVLRIMAAICDATQALHDAHILHRDIKPANIKVTSSGQPILLDLGLAKLFKDPESKTLIAAQAFTPGYAPVEQCEEGGRTTHLTDIYALGATTHYALTGRQPWEALRRLRELHAGHADMPLPGQLAPRISRAADAIVQRALALQPEARYATAREMQAALLAALVMLEATCSRCKTANEVGATICVKCSNPLHSTVPIASKLTVQREISALPATPSGQAVVPQLPSRPEQVHQRVLVARASPLALAVLILGVVSLCPAFGFFLWIFALPLGLVALIRIGRSRGARKGGGRAIAGIIFSLVGLGIVFLAYRYLRSLIGL